VTNQTQPIFALSIKQPWAALVVQGVKTIEVRRWPTTRRGTILIHAARVPDDRKEAWDLVTTEELRELAQRRGGLIGSVNLVECITYRDLPSFAKDQTGHRNELSWFEPPTLYGFRFTAPKVTPYRVYPGWFRFFTVKETTPVRTSSAVCGP